MGLGGGGGGGGGIDLAPTFNLTTVERVTAPPPPPPRSGLTPTCSQWLCCSGPRPVGTTAAEGYVYSGSPVGTKASYTLSNLLVG